MQVDPGLEAVDPTLAFRDFQGLSGTFRDFQGLSGTFRDFQLLKLKCDKLLSNFAFNCNLRHYNWGNDAPGPGPMPVGPGLGGLAGLGRAVQVHPRLTPG